MPKRSEAEDEEVSSQTGEQSSGDAWDEIEKMKSQSYKAVEDEHGFTKMNTNFYLLDGGEADIEFLTDAPIVFPAHGIKMRSKAGKTYYITEGCQKSSQNHCVLCSTKNTNVSSARNTIGFPILDYRGTWDAKANKGNGEFDGKPVAKIFLMPLGLAKSVKKLRDDVGGTLIGKVCKLTKDVKNYNANVKMVKNPADPNSYIYKKGVGYTGPIPNIHVLYAPLKDAELETLLSYGNKDNNDNSGGGQAAEEEETLFTPNRK